MNEVTSMIFHNLTKSDAINEANNRDYKKIRAYVVKNWLGNYEVKYLPTPIDNIIYVTI